MNTLFIDDQLFISEILTTCINYADLNNSMLHMLGHVSAGFFFAVTSYSCNMNTMVFVILLQVCKVNFF